MNCPHCGAAGTNDEALGGNERCYHCAECGWVECAEMRIYLPRTTKDDETT